MAVEDATRGLGSEGKEIKDLRKKGCLLLVEGSLSSVGAGVTLLLGLRELASSQVYLWMIAAMGMGLVTFFLGMRLRNVNRAEENILEKHSRSLDNKLFGYKFGP